MLGIHITVAVAWQQATSSDWTAYAANVSRRSSGFDSDAYEANGPVTIHHAKGETSRPVSSNVARS
jgi:hypothetical protein